MDYETAVAFLAPPNPVQLKNRKGGPKKDTTPGYGFWEAEYGEDEYRWFRQGTRKQKRYADGTRLKDRQVAIWEKHKEPLNRAFPVERIVGIAQAAAKETGVPFEWIMGSITFEASGFKHRGGTFGSNGIPGPSGSMKKPKRNNDSGQGLGQMQTGAFNDAVKHSKRSANKDGQNAIWWKHSDIINPKLAVWSVAYKLKRILDRRYGGDPKKVKKGDVGSWWAGKVSYSHAQRVYKAKLAKWERDGRKGKPPHKPSGMKRERYYNSKRIKRWKTMDASEAMHQGDESFPTQESMVRATK